MKMGENGSEVHSLNLSTAIAPKRNVDRSASLDTWTPPSHHGQSVTVRQPPEIPIQVPVHQSMLRLSFNQFT